jgi:hypothetical protein
MQEAFRTLADAIAGIGNIATWQSVGVISAAGTLAMAVLQLIKDLTPVRRIYQRNWMRKWIAQHARYFNGAFDAFNIRKGKVPAASPAKAEFLLIELATGGDEQAFYELAIEQMVAQMNAAVQITLDYPAKYRDLLVVVSDGADISDIATVVNQSPEGPGTRRAEPTKQYLEARMRVGHRIQRNLDAVQIALGSRWQFWMQTTAVLLSILVLEAAVLAVSGASSPTALLLAIPVGILGGYLAPVVRDLVAALQTLRNSR